MITRNRRKRQRRSRDKIDHIKQRAPSGIPLARERKRKKNKFLHDTGYNFSSNVPPQEVLRSRLHQAYPILFLPEYVKRRRTAELDLYCLKEKHNFPKEVFQHFQAFLKKCNGSLEKSCKRNKRRKRSDDDAISSANQKKYELLVRTIVVPMNAKLISKVAWRMIKATHSSPTSDTSIKYPKQAEVETSIFRVTQSASSLVDEVISTLVHRRKQNRVESGIKMASRKNMLSEGYQLGKDVYSNARTSDHNPPKRRKTLATTASFVTNMKPGVQCVRPNSCASFARSAPLMTLILKILGDDLMRELLLECMIFIPVEEDLSHQGDAKNSGGGAIESRLKKGNYFQMCGIPLNCMTVDMQPSWALRPRKRKYNLRNEAAITASVKSGKKSIDVAVIGSQCDPHQTLPRHRMFFSDIFTPKVGLPPTHILSTVAKPGASSASIEVLLLDSMVCLTSSNNTNSIRSKRWKRLRDGGINMCRRIINNHKSCDYQRILNRTCPLLNDRQPRRTKKDTASNLKVLIESRSQVESVLTCFNSILKHVFPKDFWGSAKNFQVVLRTMNRFLSAPRREKVYMKQLAEGICITDIKWIQHPRARQSHQRMAKSDHEAARRLTLSIMRWLYCDFVTPLVRSMFYVTTTQFTGDKLTFFRKPLWSQIRSLAMCKLKHQFRRISSKSASKRLQNQVLGHSRLLLIPKERGIRPIAMLCKSDKVLPKLASKTSRCMPTNKMLRQAFLSLTYEHVRQPSSFGVGLEGMHSLHQKLLSFLKTQTSCQTSCNSSKLFFTSVDIKHCFDNINQSHLLKVVNKVMRREEYVLQEHTLLHLVSPENDAKTQLKKIQYAGEPGNVKNFLDEATKRTRAHSRSVLVSNVKCAVAKKIDICNLIHEHVSRNMLILRETYGHTFMVQKKGIGIPQGSVLSTLLCNYYYGDIEVDLVEGIFEKAEGQYLLVRIIDDYLLITKEKGLSEVFLRQLQEGNLHYGIKINPEKTSTNYIVENRNLKSSRHNETDNIVDLSNDTHFRWCGLMIDTHSCEVQIDYSRFRGAKATNSISIDWANTGSSFTKKMKSFVWPRCQPILFDSRINSAKTIKANFYKMIAFSAIKSVHYIIHGLGGGVSQNINFVKECILDNILYAYGIISYRLRNLERADNEEAIDIFRSWLNYEDAKFLGAHAFQSIFARSDQPNFGNVVFYLNKICEKSKCSGSLSNIATKSFEEFISSRFE